MNGLREKFRNKKGFTLIEMLIVVAIIAILIAVSIPLVSGALESARDATDRANERAAKAEGALYYMQVIDGATPITGESQKFFYNATTGKLTDDTGKGTAYGKCTGSKTAADGGCYGTTHANMYVIVTITKNGEVSTSWGTSLT